MPKGVYERHQHRVGRPTKMAETKKEPKSLQDSIRIDPVDMKIIDAMRKADEGRSEKLDDAQYLHKIFQGYEENREFGDTERLVWGRLNKFMKDEGMVDPKLTLSKLIETFEVEKSEMSKSPYENRLNTYIVQHGLHMMTPEQLLNVLIDTYNSVQNTEHSQMQRVFDYNMDDIEQIMQEYHCTFNEAISLLVSRFRSVQRQEAKMPKSPVREEAVPK